MSFEFSCMIFKIMKMKGQIAHGVGSCELVETEILKKVQQEITQKNHYFGSGMGNRLKGSANCENKYCLS